MQFAKIIAFEKLPVHLPADRHAMQAIAFIAAAAAGSSCILFHRAQLPENLRLLPIFGDRPAFFFDFQMATGRQFPVHIDGKAIASRLTSFVDPLVQIDEKPLPNQGP